MNGEQPTFGQQPYRPPGGTVCVPPGPFSSLKIGYPPQPNIAAQNIIVGIGEFGGQVLKGFRDFNTVYRSGFNWEKGKTQLIYLNSRREVYSESSQVVLVSNQEDLRAILSQIGPGPADILRCILIADVSEGENQKLVSEIVINSYNLQTNNGNYLNWYLLLNIAPAGYSTTSRRKQSIFLRELDFWLSTGFHTPYPSRQLNRQDKLINSAVILNEAAGSDTAIKQGVLSLFSLFYKQNMPIMNTIAIRLRALGTPWLDLVDYFAVKLANDWLLNGAGVFPAYKLTPELVNNTSFTDMQAAPMDVFLQLIQDKVNSHEDFSWVSAYLSIYRKLGERNLGPISRFFDGNETYFHQLKELLNARLTQVQEKLRKATQDVVLRWNIPTDQSIDQANALLRDYFSLSDIDNIFNDVNLHVKVHCEFGNNRLVLLPLCVPSIVPTTYDYHQFVFSFPEKIGHFIDALVKLFEDLIKRKFESIPQLPQIDTSYNSGFFDDLQGISGIETKRKYVVYSSERTWPAGRNNCFSRTIKTDMIGLQEPDLIIGMIQDIGLDYQEFPAPNSYISREDLHFDPHLKNAAFFESLDDFNDHEDVVPLCREIVMTCYDRNLVVLFWKAFDRGIIFWKENEGWVFELDNIRENLSENVGYTLNIIHKNADYLWNAFENFTVKKRANLRTSETVSPFGNNSFVRTLNTLKEEIAVRPIIPVDVQWLSNEVNNNEPIEPKYSDLLRLYKICRAIPNQELL